MGNSSGCRPGSGEGNSYVVDSSLAEVDRTWEEARTEEQARELYSQEGTISIDSGSCEVEFRMLLDYVIGRNAMVAFINTLPHCLHDQMDSCLQGWMDIISFHKLAPGTEKLSQGMSIYNTYVVGNVLVPSVIRDMVSDRLVRMNDEPTLGVFVEVQRVFFDTLYDSMFLGFKKSGYYNKMNDTLRRTYNHVKCSDFDYFGVLGEGGFGLVSAVTKKSTGRIYAMKLQEKEHIYNMCQEGHGPDIERKAFASCKHPFVVELFFAFQTKKLAILVMTLCNGHDLGHVLTANRGPLSLEQARFYTAEITSAISYFHKKGFIYRDLKPANVTLNEDGHIMLVDFGSVGCLKKNVRKAMSKSQRHSRIMLAKSISRQDTSPLPLTDYWKKEATSANVPMKKASSEPSAAQNSPGTASERRRRSGSSVVPINYNSESVNSEPDTVDIGDGTYSRNGFARPSYVKPAEPPRLEVIPDVQDVRSYNNTENENHTPIGKGCSEDSESQVTKRAHSLIGTFGYMAPEMVLILLSEEGWSHNGYTRAVDWWSLGVTIYRLLTDSFPFQVVFVEQLGADLDSEGFETQMSGALAKYSSLFEAVDYSVLEQHPEAVDLVSRLLVPEERDRLGFGHSGSTDISAHPFFEKIDWVALEQKLVVPPPKPAGWTSALGKGPGKGVLARKYESVEHMLFSQGKQNWMQHLGGSKKNKPQPGETGQAASVFWALGNSTPRADLNTADPEEKAVADMRSKFEMWDYTAASAVKLEIGTRHGKGGP